MRGKAGTRGCYGGGNALYLRTRYCTPERMGIEDCSGMIPLAQYCREKGITRHKADGLLKRRHLLCMSIEGTYWVMENPDNPITERELTRRLPKRKISKTRGTFESERDWYVKDMKRRTSQVQS